MKYLILLALFIPLTASAAWYQPWTWFSQTQQANVNPLQCDPQIVERIVEVEKIVEVPVEIIVEKPVDKVVTQTQYVPIEKIVTKEVPTESEHVAHLKFQISQWENALAEFKPQVENLTPLVSYYKLIKLYDDLMAEHYELLLEYNTATGQGRNLQYKEAPEPAKCAFYSDENNKGKVVCD